MVSCSRRCREHRQGAGVCEQRHAGGSLSSGPDLHGMPIGAACHCRGASCIQRAGQAQPDQLQALAQGAAELPPAELGKQWERQGQAVLQQGEPPGIAEQSQSAAQVVMAPPGTQLASSLHSSSTWPSSWCTVAC